jgi:hypothetical protein
VFEGGVARNVQKAEIRLKAPTEVRIAYEVAVHLRMLPRFSDDGAPEGTVERAAEEDAGHAPSSPAFSRGFEVVDEEDEVEIHLDETL